MHVEDHPLDYATFEGVIPAGEYGGGTVMVWDQGTWEPEQEDVDAALQKGDLKFTLHGKKLKGSWVLVRTRGYGGGSSGGSSSRSSWLLIKHRDAYTSTEDIAESQPSSVVSRRLLADIARDNNGDVKQAATGDPAKKSVDKKANEKADPVLQKPRPKSRAAKKKKARA
jgi:bifunctional non-homologous end joining protein LigD